MRGISWLGLVVVCTFALTANVSFAIDAPQKIFIFFYSGDCHYCHEMADSLVTIQKKHGVRIIANSLDGKKIAQFPNALFNDDISRKFKISATPAVVAVDMRDKTFEVVSLGLEAQALLEAKILAVLNDA